MNSYDAVSPVRVSELWQQEQLLTTPYWASVEIDRGSIELPKPVQQQRLISTLSPRAPAFIPNSNAHDVTERSSNSEILKLTDQPQPMQRSEERTHTEPGYWRSVSSMCLPASDTHLSQGGPESTSSIVTNPWEDTSPRKQMLACLERRCSPQSPSRTYTDPFEDDTPAEDLRTRLAEAPMAGIVALEAALPAPRYLQRGATNEQDGSPNAAISHDANSPSDLDEPQDPIPQQGASPSQEDSNSASSSSSTESNSRRPSHHRHRRHSSAAEDISDELFQSLESRSLEDPVHLERRSSCGIIESFARTAYRDGLHTVARPSYFARYVTEVPEPV